MVTVKSLTITYIIISITTVIFSLAILLEQYPQEAQAYPCIGGEANKEYCIGYNIGAIQAHRDYSGVNDIGLDEHQCKGNHDYCQGYDRGYNDEADFLG